MGVTRREFVMQSAAALAAAAVVGRLEAAEAPRYRVSARTGSFGGKYDAGKRAGLEGVELGVGGPAEKLSIADPANRAKIKEQVAAAGLVVSSLSMDLLNGNPLATDPQAPAWVEQTIEACVDLGAKGILVPFFGKAHLLEGKAWKQADVDALVPRLKAAAPKAKDAGVNLCIECSLSAQQYHELLDRVGSDVVAAYYDIGNCTGAGFDVPGDIKSLGKRMALIHFKDNPSFLGEGKVALDPVAAALKAIDYRGWLVLETNCPSGNPEADCAKNVATVKRVMGL